MVAALSVVTLIAAGITAALAPVHSVFALTVALGLLGLGWSFGLVSGTSMITSSIPLPTRASTQGTVDVAIAGGGLGSGIMVAHSSYTTLALTGAAVSLLIIPALGIATSRTSQRIS